MVNKKTYEPKYGYIYKKNSHDHRVNQLLSIEEDKHIIHPVYSKYKYTPYTYSDNPYYKKFNPRYVSLYNKFGKDKLKEKNLFDKASVTQSNYVDEIFGINSILKNLGSKKGPLLFFLILWLLLCFHIAFGYTVNLKRLIVAFSLSISSMIMIIIFNLILKKIDNYPKNKYFLIPLTLVIFLVGFIRISYIIFTTVIFKDYKKSKYTIYP